MVWFSWPLFTSAELVQNHAFLSNRDHQHWQQTPAQLGRVGLFKSDCEALVSIQSKAWTGGQMMACSVLPSSSRVTCLFGSQLPNGMKWKSLRDYLERTTFGSCTSSPLFRPHFCHCTCSQYSQCMSEQGVPGFWVHMTQHVLLLHSRLFTCFLPKVEIILEKISTAFAHSQSCFAISPPPRGCVSNM